MMVQTPLPIRIITQNVRYDATWRDRGEEKWRVRLPKQVQQFKFFVANQPASFILLQEPLQNQVEDIVNGLNTGSQQRWTFIGRGRDDKGWAAGNEFNPILYQPDIWNLEQWWTRWLSKTPEVPSSVYPGAGLALIVTVGKFRHKATGYEVLVLCTHLDHVSPEVRRGQAGVVVATASEFSEQEGGQPDLPVLVGGDFNSPPSEEAYRYMTIEAPFIDAYLNICEGGYRHGNELTWTGFTEDIERDRLDFVFLRNKDDGSASSSRPQWQVQGHAVPSNVFDDEIYLSDHRAVVVDLLLKS